MRRRLRLILLNFDFEFFLLTILLILIGIITIYSATLYVSYTNFALRQIVNFGVGLVAMILVILVDYRTLLRYQSLFYWVLVAILIALLIYGGVGNKKVDRYIKIGPLPPLTPSEFMKFAFILRLSYLLGKRVGQDWRFHHLLIPVINFAIPVALILLQPNLGTAMMFFPILVVMFIVAGFPFKKLLILALIGIIGIVLIFKFYLKPYQKERITGFLKSEGWQLNQSKIAIGSGGLIGKGYLKGTQSKLEFIPAKHTDFILSVFAEEWGFIGVVVLFFIYILWLNRAVNIALKVSDIRGKLIIMGILALVCSQLIINTGMIVGLFPITGLTLPFISYGGSSMLTNMLCVGLILNISIRRND